MRSARLHFAILIVILILGSLPFRSLSQEGTYPILVDETIVLNGDVDRATQKSSHHSSAYATTQAQKSDFSSHENDYPNTLYGFFGRGGDFNPELPTESGNLFGVGLETQISPDYGLFFEVSRLKFNSNQGFSGDRRVENARLLLASGLKFHLFDPQFLLQPTFGVGLGYATETVKSTNEGNQSPYFRGERLQVDRILALFNAGVDLPLHHRFSMGFQFTYFLPLSNRDGINDGPNRDPSLLTFESKNFYRVAALAKFHF